MRNFWAKLFSGIALFGIFIFVRLPAMIGKAALHGGEIVGAGKAGRTAVEDAAIGGKLARDVPPLHSPISEELPPSGASIKPALHGAELVAANSDQLIPRNTSHKTIVVAPDNPEEAAAIFGQTATLAKRAKAVTDSKTARGMLVENFILAREEQAFFEQILTSDEVFFTIIGHSEDGLLILPNGSRISLVEISENCLRAAKICIFLSCRSATLVDSSLGMKNELTYGDGTRIANAIGARLNSYPAGGVTAAQMRSDLADLLHANEIGISGAVAMHVLQAPAAVGGVGLITIEAVDKDQA